jgi:hemolysin activation/secretion protein
MGLPVTPLTRSFGPCGFAAAFVLLSAMPALAQPSSAQPSQLDQRFQQRPAAPSVGSPVEIPNQAPPTGPSAQGVTFTVRTVVFEGNTKLSDGVLQAIAGPYTGRAISLADANELASKVTAAYRDAGYILSRAIVPAQNVTDGTLHIRIIEGRIDQTKIEGNPGGARSYLEAYGARITADQPLTADVLERELLLASDLQGVNVRSVLTASQTVPGAADLTLVVDPHPVEGYISADNHGSRYLGTYEIQGAFFFNDAFGTGGRLGLNGVVTPNSGPDLAYGGISFDQPLGTNGLRLFTNFSYAATEPGEALRTLDSRGTTLNGSASLSYPFIRSRDFNLQGAVGFEVHDVQSWNAAVKPLFYDHIRALDASLFINALDAWGGYSTASVNLVHGVPMFGATKSDDPNKSRVGASGDYTRTGFLASHEHPFGDRFSIALGAAGQTSFGDPLLASEQFSLGGDMFDRGFDPSEVTGDSGIAGRVEPRMNLANNLSILSNLQLFGFLEGGTVWQAQAVAGIPESQSLESTGAGLRFLVASRMNAELQWARPLNRNVVALSNQASRFLFSVGMNF